MIKLQKIKDLNLDKPLQAGRPSFISAASGLVTFRDHFYVAADDELSIFCFTYEPTETGQAIEVFSGKLPVEVKARKKEKPDLEALVYLPASDALPHGSLLSFPSGSTIHRNRGTWIALNENFLPSGCPQTFNASLLYDGLRQKFSDLNLEAAVIAQDRLRLFQRGNGISPNATVDLLLSEVLLELENGILTPGTLLSTRIYELGTLNGVKLSFTDAAVADDNTVLFTAVAEDTKSTYYDGRFFGAVVGRLDSKGDLQSQTSISPSIKVEGMSLQGEGKDRKVYFVTDGDDPTQAAGLYGCSYLSLMADCR